MQTNNGSCKPAGSGASAGSATGCSEHPNGLGWRSSAARSTFTRRWSTTSPGTTLVSASTLDPEVRTQLKYGGNKAAAAFVGRVVAERAKKAGIDKVCFDRRSYKYHGRVAALAQAAREAGLKF